MPSQSMALCAPHEIRNFKSPCLLLIDNLQARFKGFFTAIFANILEVSEFERIYLPTYQKLMTLQLDLRLSSLHYLTRFHCHLKNHPQVQHNTCTICMILKWSHVWIIEWKLLAGGLEEMNSKGGRAFIGISPLSESLSNGHLGHTSLYVDTGSVLGPG